MPCRSGRRPVRAGPSARGMRSVTPPSCHARVPLRCRTSRPRGAPASLHRGATARMMAQDRIANKRVHPTGRPRTLPRFGVDVRLMGGDGLEHQKERRWAGGEPFEGACVQGPVGCRTEREARLVGVERMLVTFDLVKSEVGRPFAFAIQSERTAGQKSRAVTVRPEGAMTCAPPAGHTRARPACQPRQRALPPTPWHRSNPGTRGMNRSRARPVERGA